PVTSAPRASSHSHSHAPLNPVWPVTKTRRPANAPPNERDTGGAWTWAVELIAAPLGLRPASVGLPYFPRGPVLRPQAIEVLRFLIRIHRLPEAVVLVGVELAVARQLLERLAFQHDGRIVREIIEEAVVAD